MQMNVNLTYPYDPEFKYETILKRINLDDERIRDLQIGKGFIIAEPQSIKKDIKDYNGIFSTRFGGIFIEGILICYNPFKIESIPKIIFNLGQFNITLSPHDIFMKD